MVAHSSEFAARAMEATVLAGDADRRWRGAEIDTRRMRGDEIFFALPGTQVDGHDFLPQALAAGAAAVVVHREPDPAVLSTPVGPERGPVWLQVDDTYQALHALTRAVRAEVPERLVAITGSAGKTTTKEMLAAMLGRSFRTDRSPGNFNNLLGFPLALMGIADDCQWMVAEMGMSTPGELGEVSRLGRPDVALFTNIRPVHLENFPNLTGIAEAKAELLQGLAPGGLIVANADDPEVVGLVERHAPEGSRRLDYGFGATAAVRGVDLRPGPHGLGSRFRLVVDGVGEVDLELAVHGLYNAENGLAAAACAQAVGVPLDAIATALATFRPSRLRGEVVHVPGGPTLVDDCYNSNPDAAEKALDSARQLRARRRWAVLGDMLELGPRAAEFHAQVGRRAAEHGFVVLGVGPLSESLVDAAVALGAHGEWLADAEGAAERLRQALADGELGEDDLVLVKGSRGIGLEVASQVLRPAATGGDA